MVAGYCYGDGLRYYCSEECLHEHFTDEEWEQEYEDGDCYWTEWYDETLWRVDAVSEEGVAKLIAYFGSRDEAESFCESYRFVLRDPEEGGKWALEIHAPTDGEEDDR